MSTAKRHIDLHETRHPECEGKSCKERINIEADGLCSNVVSTQDGLPVRCVGHWAYDKIYRLVQYFGIFSGGMKKKWVGLNYVEICSGPGRCILREDGTEIDGTALAIIHSPNFDFLRKAIFIDGSQRVVDTLNERIKNLGVSQIAHAMVGNYEDGPGLCQILSCLPPGCLNFVFIDPTECDVPFATIKGITDHLQNADLLINVAIGTDVNRNIVNAATDPSFARVRQKYEQFLGLPGFCSRPDVLELAQREDHDDLRRQFADAYKDQLGTLGYDFTDIRKVKHYYYLLFASRKSKGLEFWRKSCTYAPDNQKELL